MRNFLVKLAKWSAAALGVVVILVALAVGGFRLFIGQLPSYQTELQSWVAAELGVAVTFGQLDARWGMRGPELTLHDVRIGSLDGAQSLLTATRAAVGLDALALLIDRQPRVARLTVEGSTLSVERGADGAFRLAGAGLSAAASGDFSVLVPDEVELEVRDSRLSYVDVARARSWQFDDVTMSLARRGGALTVEARGVPEPELASRVAVSVEAEIGGGAARADEWRVASDLQDVDLAVLAQLLPIDGTSGLGGRGAAAVSVAWSAGRIVGAGASLALADVALPGPDGAGARAFEQLELDAEWRADAGSGWELVLGDVVVERAGRRWTSDGDTTLVVARADGVMSGLDFRGEFVRLEDLTPLVLVFAATPPAQQWLELDPRGELSDVDFTLRRDADGEWDYALAVRFAGLGLAATPGRPGIKGLTGAITTGTRSGTIEFQSADLALDWPEIFAAPLRAEALTGSLLWRQGRDVARVVSNDLTLSAIGSDVRSSLELTLPLDGSAPVLDIESTAASVDLVAGKQFLPVHKMPRGVVDWLDNAVRAGEGRNLEFTFFGPIDAFPFDQGEGHFRVTADVRDVVLEFIDGWPVAEDVQGTVEFVNAGFKSAGGGRILGNRGTDVRVEIPELRDAVLSYSGRTEGPLADVLAFVRGAPLIAAHLGPGYERLHAHAGRGTVDLRLDLPLRERSAFVLDAELAIGDGELSVDGFGPHATDIDGVLEIDGNSVRGRGIEALFLDGPVRASLAAADEPDYAAVLMVDGETTADGVVAAFGLPFADRFAGQTRWQGRLMLPGRSAARAPLRIEVQSNLTGMSLKFPPPLEKAPGEPSNLQVEFVIPPGGGLDVDGNVGATRRFTLRYALAGERFVFDRGTVQFGGNRPELPAESGLLVRGTLPELDLGSWLALGATRGAGSPLVIGAQLELAEFSAFGQRLGTTRIDVRRAGAFWNADIDSEAVAGNILIPRSLSARPQIVANMERVYLAAGASDDSTQIDPRTLPGLMLTAEEFGVGARQLGRVVADVVADPLGLRLVSFASESASFEIEGSGSWLDGPAGPATRAAVGISSNDVGTAFEELGIGMFMDGELADVTASVHWAGPPGADWLDHVNGDVAVHVETGSLLELDPGAGRVVGLLSIATLPRRLALDFRDVFNRGFVFDEISGDFTLIDGNAYTDNLKMSGPGAEIGVIGRTGLRDRDYQQQAVVTAEPSNMLPTVGALVAGPGVGAAWLLFTRIFKEPLKGIGRASYCVTGTWDEPKVERLSGERLEQAEQCVALPPSFTARIEEESAR